MLINDNSSNHSNRHNNNDNTSKNNTFFASGCCALPHCRKMSVLSGLALGGLSCCACTVRPLSHPLASGGGGIILLVF